MTDLRLKADVPGGERGAAQPSSLGTAPPTRAAGAGRAPTTGRPVRSVAVYVPSLSGGGAERVAALLASGFADAGVLTTLVVEWEDEANAAHLDPRVATVVIGRGHGRGVLALARWLSRERPDVALAIDAPASLKLVAAKRLARAPTAVVVSFHGFAAAMAGRLGRIAYASSPLLVRFADLAVCVSAGIADDLGRRGAPAGRLATIANPVPAHARPAATEADLLARAPLVLALGRLVPGKRFDLLLDALAALPPDVRAEIYGEGPSRPALEGAAARLGGRAALPGYAADPWPLYGRARVLVVTSDSESFGNVIVEALSAGLPVVATDCGGPREILDHPLQGSLVPVGDADALAGALARWLVAPGDPAPRVARAADFAPKRAVDAYLAAFARLVRP